MSINHICVFLLGTVSFPEGYAATVHFHWPGRGFQLLGMLSNEKPSAIFRLRGTYTAASNNSGPQVAFSSAASDPAVASSPGDVNALLGIAIEALPSVLTQCASLPVSAPAQSSLSTSGSEMTKFANPNILTEKIVRHFFKYISSFATSGGTLTPETYVPLGAVTKWYDSFLGKVKAGGIGFLERDD